MATASANKFPINNGAEPLRPSDVRRGQRLQVLRTETGLSFLTLVIAAPATPEAPESGFIVKPDESLFSPKGTPQVVSHAELASGAVEFYDHPPAFEAGQTTEPPVAHLSIVPTQTEQLL